MDPASKRAKPPGVSNARRLLILSLRYAISPKEYAVLRRRILLKGPGSLRAAAPSKAQFDAVCYEPGRDDYLPAASRAGLRVFLLTYIVLNSWDIVVGRLAKGRRKGVVDSWAKKAIGTPATGRTTPPKSPNLLFSLSLSTMVVAHRLLYKFFFRLRGNLLLPQARTFRLRHPKVARLFLSRLSPSIGSALAGLALLIYPAGDRRTTVSAWTFVKALEFCYNRLEDEGWFRNKPWVIPPRLFLPCAWPDELMGDSGLRRGCCSRLLRGNCFTLSFSIEIASHLSMGVSSWGIRRSMSKLGRWVIRTICNGQERMISWIA